MRNKVCGKIMYAARVTFGVADLVVFVGGNVANYAKEFAGAALSGWRTSLAAKRRARKAQA